MKKKIAIIVQSLTGGGAERAAANLSIDLSENHDVTLIVFNSENISYPYKGHLINLGVKVQNNIFRKVIGFLKKIYLTKKIKKENKFDYVISFMENANIINVLSRCKEKVVISERNMISFFNKSKIKKSLIKFAGNKADYIIALSKGVKQDLIDNFKLNPDKIVVIYNSCTKDNLQTFDKNTIEEYKKIENDRYIVNMGRLHYQKGQWHLIKAFSLIADNFPELKLVILGQGPLEAKLKELTLKLNLEDRVIFCGYLKQPHIFLKNAELFVFSSIVEGLGNVLLEALNFDKAIISTDCYYGPREILAPKTDIQKLTSDIELAEYGVLVPNFDKKAFDDSLDITNEERLYAKALEDLLRDENLRNRYEKSAHIRASDFSPENIKNEWNEFIV